MSKDQYKGDSPEIKKGHTIAEALTSYLQSEGLKDAQVVALISSCWTDIVGGDVASHVIPWSVDGDTLLVNVDHAGWATELAFLSESILARLNEHLGSVVIRRIKTRIRP